MILGGVLQTLEGDSPEASAAMAAEMEHTLSQVTDCTFEVRPDAKRPMFYVREDGWGKFFLDGYVIVPKEKYEALLKQEQN